MSQILPAIGLRSNSVGLKGEQKPFNQQLAVVMSECISCVQSCPSYKKQPFKADTFDEFEGMAKAQCGSCFNGVKGPCPANKDNHGVLSSVLSNS